MNIYLVLIEVHGPSWTRRVRGLMCAATNGGRSCRNLQVRLWLLLWARAATTGSRKEGLLRAARAYEFLDFMGFSE